MQKDGNPCNDNSNVIEIIKVENGNGDDRTNKFEIIKNPRGNGDTTWSIRNKKVYPFLSDSNIDHNYQITLKLTANGQTVNITTLFKLDNVTPSVYQSVTTKQESIIYYEWLVTEGLTFEPRDDFKQNVIPINCSGIALQSTNGTPIPINTEEVLYNEFAIVNGVEGGNLNPNGDSNRQIVHTCNLIDVNNGRDYNSVLEVEVIPAGNGTKLKLKAKSGLSRNDFPSPASVSFSTDPTFLATFEVVSTSKTLL